MWKYPPFIEFLGDLVAHPLVGEIIIINNALAHTPTDAVILQHPKIKMKNFMTNIIVNAAWNFGVGQSENERVCILNDDVTFDLRVFNRVIDFLEPKKFLAVVPDTHHQLNGHVVTGMIKIDPYTRGDDMFQFGMIMFICKQDWIDIPAGLDMFYGDYWTFETMYTRYGQNYAIRDVFFFTPGETTASQFSNKQEIYNRETQIYTGALELFNKNHAQKNS
jgi:hypothetical protein